MGAWEAYALQAPSDRLLPFVLSRRALPSNAPWISCAWVQHADTGARVKTLVPTGAVTPVPALGIVFTKLLDGDTEYFTYDGALIPNVGLPCDVPLRLVIDNAYQSPRFFALAPASALRSTHLLLEWYHSGPLHGVPYGRGFRQRFYLENGALQELDPREEEVTNKNPDTGEEKTVSLNLFGQKAFAIDPVPAYLKQAMHAARAVRYFLADGQEWKLLSAKATSAAADGGRWSVAGTLESKEPLLSRGCLRPLLATVAYDPVANVPRGWRCGDTSDTAPDFRPTGTYSCELSTGVNTGYVLETYRDYNPYSASSGQNQQRRSASQDLARCPVPVAISSAEQRATAQKNDCPSGQIGSVETLVVPAGAYTSQVGQADADAQAQAYAQSQVQAYANMVGTCQPGGPATYIPSYSDTGCFSCQMVNQANATDVRDATAAEVRRYYRTTNNIGDDCPRCII